MGRAMLLEAAGALSLSERERSQIAAIERRALAANPDEFAQLLTMVEEPEVKQRYRELGQQAPDMLREEMAWLADLIRQALVEANGEAPWAVLYLTLAHEIVLCAKLEHRLHPLASIVMPSPFVYAMQ